MIVNREFPGKLVPILFEHKRFKILYGSRGSAKSRSIARLLILKAHTECVRILCTRELQKSIKDSVLKLLENTINDFGLSDFFDVQRDRIIGSNGSEFIFMGLKSNPAAIKSLEDVKYVWIEEADSISQESLDLLIPTIRAEDSEIIFVFNPFSDLDPVYEKFVLPYLDILNKTGVYVGEDTLVIKMNYEDNPWFPDVLRIEMEKCKKENYQKYLHIWNGECVGAGDDLVINPLWVNASIDAHIKLGFKSKGLKVTGFDPADEGGDNKAMVSRYGSVITHMDSWYEGGINDACDRVWNHLEGNKSTDLVYDGVGVGAAVKTYMGGVTGNTDLFLTNFIGSKSPRDATSEYSKDMVNGDMFLNIRAQGYWLLRDRFEATYRAIQGEYINPDMLISLPSDLPHLRDLRRELNMIERVRGRDRVQIIGKDKMLTSPGLADALMYCFMADQRTNDEWSKPIDYGRSRAI